VKNGFVVTWLTKTNLYAGCEPKTLAEPPLLDDALLPQAARIELTEPAATPVSAVRRRKVRRSKPGRFSVIPS
jgi:hypothetical protein